MQNHNYENKEKKIPTRDKRLENSVISVSTEIVLVDRQITFSILESIASLKAKVKKQKKK